MTLIEIADIQVGERGEQARIFYSSTQQDIGDMTTGLKRSLIVGPFISRPEKGKLLYLDEQTAKMVRLYLGRMGLE